MFLTRKNIKKIDEDNDNKNDIQSEDKVFNSERPIAIANANAGKRNQIVDISGVENEVQKNNRIVDNDKLQMEFTRLTPDVVSGKIVYSANMKQISIYNPTAAIIKLGFNGVDTTSYNFIINGMKLVVLPPFVCREIYYLQEGVLSGFVTPIIFAYAEANQSVGISVIT